MAIIIDEAKELNINSQSVCNFYKKHWKRGIALSELSFYQWQFTASPSDAGDDHCMIAIDNSSNQLLGVMGLNTRPFFLGGADKRGAEFTTWIVDEKFLGQGIGTQILKKMQSKYDVLIGMGVSDMSLSIFMRNGFRYIRAIPRYIKVFDFDSIETYAKCNPLAKKLIKQWYDLGADVPFRTEAIDEGKIDAIESIARSQLNLFSRDYKFLEWRYSNHPIFNFKQFLINSIGENQGKGVYVCVREETNIKNLRILHVLDCIGDQKDMPAAISFIQDYCVKNNIHLVDFYCTSTQISRHFIASGWFSINDDTYFQFPHLFHPIELRTPPTRSLIYWSKEHFLEMANISKLYITKQDVDFDRPTLETFEKFNSKKEKL